MKNQQSLPTKSIFTIPQAGKGNPSNISGSLPVCSESNSLTHIDSNMSHVNLEMFESDHQEEKTCTPNRKHKSRTAPQNKLSQHRNNHHRFLILKLKHYLCQQLIILHAEGKIDYEKCNDILLLLGRRNLEIETLQFLILQYEPQLQSYKSNIICHHCKKRGYYAKCTFKTFIGHRYGESQKFGKQKVSPIQKNYAYSQNLNYVKNSFSKLEIN